MALIKCPECSREISDKAESCPHCGLPLSKVILAPAVPETPHCTETVSCLDCNKEFYLDEEVCPYCGLFNSQKYKDQKKPDKKPTQNINLGNPQKTPTSGKDKDMLTTAFIILFISIFVGGATESVIVSLVSFAILLIATLRANHLAKYPEKRIKYERHIYTWKGILAYLLIVVIIMSIEKSNEDHRNELKKEQEIQTNNKLNKNHLSLAKALIAKSPNLSVEEWLNVKNHLTAIPKDAAEYAEAQKLLPSATQNSAAYLKKEQDNKRKQAEIDKKKAFEQETAGLNAKGRRLKAKHPDWSIEDCDTISKGRINIGMTEEQVAAAWGRPYHINKTHSSYGTHSQWVMHEMGNTYIYFENGVCTTIQN